MAMLTVRAADTDGSLVFSVSEGAGGAINITTFSLTIN